MIDTKFDTFATEIAARQYFQPGETTVEQMLRRAADVINMPWLSDVIYNLMRNKRFFPGGRILAGAGTDHGNLLNCFCQDEWPFDPGTTKGALHLAKKLALVTKVGGGNGINLDEYKPKFELDINDKHLIGSAFLTIEPGHPQSTDLLSGTFYDVGTDKTEDHSYKSVLIARYEETQNLSCWKEMPNIQVPDDTRGIWDSAATMVHHMLNGEDVLVDLSALRPENSPVRGSGGTSSGPVSFAAEIFDNFATWARLGGAESAGPVATLRYIFAPTLRVIRQGGVRRGAGMATLSVRHPDIIDFITSKDLDREADEGDISTFNISVLAPEEFMNAAIDSCTSDEQRLLRKIAHHAWATGEPGMIYVDEINRHNALNLLRGPIKMTNPCGEIPLYPGEPCDLGALNISAYVVNGEMEWQELQDDASHAAQYLDEILNVENAPLPEIRQNIDSKRRIGLGMMGLGDALIKLGMPYNSHVARRWAVEVASTITRGALDYSYAAIKDLGLPVPSDLEAAGIERRNVAVVTVAPTGTTSMVAGTTSGIEPLFAPFIYRRVGAEYKQVLHPLFKEMMLEYRPDAYLCTWKPIISDNPAHEGAKIPDEWDWDKVTQAISENHGSVKDLIGIPLEVQRVFVCAHDILPMEHVGMQAAIQEGFNYPDDAMAKASNSISKTINLPSSATIEAVMDVYMDGYRMKLKGVTVYRDGSRGMQVLSTSINEDDGSTQRSQERDEQLGEIIAATCALEGTCDI